MENWVSVGHSALERPTLETPNLLFLRPFRRHSLGGTREPRAFRTDTPSLVPLTSVVLLVSAVKKRGRGDR